jgi:hypothetical protein
MPLLARFAGRSSENDPRGTQSKPPDSPIDQLLQNRNGADSNICAKTCQYSPFQSKSVALSKDVPLCTVCGIVRATRRGDHPDIKAFLRFKKFTSFAVVPAYKVPAPAGLVNARRCRRSNANTALQP